ncbi:hypothetical protein A1A1_11842 [Planococcus antarcticus DSM 14505]|uniref:DUF4181 domain-containing protein n=1 Tax=Planococcus antarcticus DSM 14505 TaxID=1185653 RepID=A0A1C7DDG3_9BACL|nr:DUF4181 domain-containing protein [Planococcus antarcticus]ANU09478.1 hypothetical protein BBH88_03720 [Planococcus antarcticus DSM 14505]EIM06253.1 hypothetical protein A1A1_11842 [Planococcus antarcticus DSM 14505]
MEFDAIVVGETLTAMVGEGVSESEVALRFILFVCGSIVSIYLVDMVLKKILKVEKKKSSSTRYINDLHRKWDRMISVGSGVLVLITLLIAFEYSSVFSSYLFMLGVIPVILQLLVQVGFEKKYAENPNEYLYTLLGAVTMSVSIITLLFIFSPSF